jgi:hypothetical protein
MPRQLSAKESEAVRSGLRQTWAWEGGYWYPLQGDSPRHSLALNEERWAKLAPDDRIRALLAQHEPGVCYRIREHDPDEETTVAELDSVYGWSEQFLVPASLEWVVYWSHEGTLTLAGRSLVAWIRDQVPDLETAAW